MVSKLSEQLPKPPDLLWPALQVVREHGGSITVEEHDNAVASKLALTDEQLAEEHGDGPSTEFSYRMGWVRTYLKNIGALQNSARGVWALTEQGGRFERNEMPEALRRWQLERRRTRAEREEDGDGEEEQPSWADVLLDRLRELSGGAFERLAQRLLREAGFLNVEVLGRSGDGGIDGVGHYRMSLVTFPIYFQCKRYSGSVPSKEIRDFRGAMQGRGEKGLFITTGVFTRDAQQEATRDGAPPIDLVDGNRLCELLKEFGLGVSVLTRIVEDVTIDSKFFEQFESWGPLRRCWLR